MPCERRESLHAGAERAAVGDVTLVIEINIEGVGERAEEPVQVMVGVEAVAHGAVQRLEWPRAKIHHLRRHVIDLFKLGGMLDAKCWVQMDSGCWA